MSKMATKDYCESRSALNCLDMLI
jgi:hypothetical protein